MKRLVVDTNQLGEQSAAGYQRVFLELLDKAGFKRDAPVNKTMHRDGTVEFRQHLPNECERCHRIDGTVVRHHVFGRNVAPHLKEDPDNWAYLCHRHHVEDPQFSAHLTPKLFIEWLTRKRGEVWYAKLKEKVHHKGWLRENGTERLAEDQPGAVRRGDVHDGVEGGDRPGEPEEQHPAEG